ncbi:MAG: ATP-binding cassette domain-containing protein [Solirubrobacterales bacterium]
MPIIFDQTGYQYHQGMPWEREALRRIDVTLETGEIVGVAGATGSGKSTLLQLMNGILLPTSGRVLVDGEDTRKLKGSHLTELRKKVGLVLQFPEDQLFEPTVFRDIAYGPRNLGIRGDELAERVRWAMAIVGLDFERQQGLSPQVLSGGQKRRAAIAGVLAMRPDYLVLDEPAAGLDYEGRQNLLAMIQQLRKDYGMGIVMVSHRLSDLLAVCDRAVVLRDGDIVCDGSPRTILTDPDGLAKSGLTAPTVSRMLHALRSSIPALATDAADPAEAAAGIAAWLA